MMKISFQKKESHFRIKLTVFYNRINKEVDNEQTNKQTLDLIMEPTEYIFRGGCGDDEFDYLEFGLFRKGKTCLKRLKILMNNN